MNLWLLAGLSVMLNTMSKLIERAVAKEVNPLAFSWLNQVIASLVLIPFAFAVWKTPSSNSSWLIILFGGIFWLILSLCQYTSIKKTEVSLKEPLSQSRLIWALIFGVVFLGEVVSISRTIGTLLVVCGGMVLVFHPERKWGRLKDSGVRWTLGTAVVSATVALVDKFALGYFPSEMYAFLAFFVPAILLSCVVHRKKEAVEHLLKKHCVRAISSIILSALSYLLFVQVLSRIDLTQLYPFMQLTTVLTVIGGMVILGERDHVKQRLIGTIFIIAGVIVVKVF